MLSGMRSHFGMRLAGGYVYNGKQEVVDARIQVFVLGIQVLMCFSGSEFMFYTQYFKVCVFVSSCVSTILEIACIFSTAPREFSSGSELWEERAMNSSDKMI